MTKNFTRNFDDKKTQQFIYAQDGFSAALDKKLGFQYSDNFSIRQMREEIFSIMKKVNKTGKYSQYKTERSNKLFVENESPIVHFDSYSKGDSPEMNINNNYTPVAGNDNGSYRFNISLKKKIDI